MGVIERVIPVGERASTAGTLQAFKAVADNAFTRSILKTLSKNCARDRDNRLEVALELYVGTRDSACLSCKLSRVVLTPILKSACRGFGVSEEQLKSRFQDAYWRRALVSVVKGIAWFGVKRPFIPAAPFQVVWNITQACNLNCVHCYENAGAKGHNELSTDEAIRGIDVLADSGVLILAFSGGEPTIRHDILKLVKHASDRGMFTAVATNAVTFARRSRVQEFKKAGLEFAQISLDGINPETHDSFQRAPGSFNKTVQGIKNCVAEDLFVELATTGTRYNIAEVPRLIEFAAQLRVNWFMLYNFIPTGRGADIAEADLSPDEREEVLKLCWNRMKLGGVDVLSTAPQYARVAQETEAKALLQSRDREGAGLKKGSEQATVVPTHFYNPKFSGQLNQLAEFVGGCGAGRFYICLEPNGDIYPCVFFPHEPAVKVGNLLRDDFEQIWRRSELFWQIRDKDKLKANCGNCRFRYTCGGCRARAYNYFKDVLAPDPGCVRNRNAWQTVQLNVKAKKRIELGKIAA